MPWLFVIDAENGLSQPSETIWYPHCGMDFENYVLLGLAGTLSSRRRAVQCWQWVTAVGGAVTAPPVTDPSRQKGNIGCSELPRRMLVAQATVKEQKTKEN